MAESNENYRLDRKQLEFYPRNHARTTRTWILWSLASNERRGSVPSTAKFTIAFDSRAEPSRIEQREPLYPRYRNVPAVCNRAHRAISISTVKHLFAKLRPRERNGNNAHGAMDTSVRRIITALNTEALDISVISVFMIVAYALLVSPFPPLPSFPLSAPSFLSFIHSLFVYHVHEHSVVGELSIGRAEMDLPIYVSL